MASSSGLAIDPPVFFRLYTERRSPVATGRDGWLAAVGSLLTLMLETRRRLMACLTSPKIITNLHVLSCQDGDFGLKRTSC